MIKLNRPIAQNDICIWPDTSYCRFEDLEYMLETHSDDYYVVAYDSFEAAHITGAVEDACMDLFGHDLWQALSEEHLTQLHNDLGIAAPTGEQHGS